MTGKVNKKGLVVLIAIVAISLIVIIVSFVFGNSSSTKDKTYHLNGYAGRPNYSAIKIGEERLPVFSKKYLAILPIEGTIESLNNTYDQQYLLDTIDTISCDENNIGLILYIDSPGGTIYEADELYLALLDYKHFSNRPVWAYFGPMAASGGYYIGCAADMIVANRNTLTGSIGVIAGSSLDLTGLMDKYGIKMTTFTAGKNKNMMNYNSPLTQEQVDIMQSVADDAYEQFVSIVAESRVLDIDVVKRLADGRVYTATQALENHLIDNIARFDETILWMSDYEFENESFELQLFEKKKTTSFYDYLINASSVIGRFVNLLGITNSSNNTLFMNQNSGLPSIIQDYISTDISYPAYIYQP